MQRTKRQTKMCLHFCYVPYATNVFTIFRRLGTDFEGPPPPVRKRKGSGPEWIPLRVCGFAFTCDDFISYAKKYFPEEIDALTRTGDYPEAQLLDYRRQEAIIYLKEALDDPQIDAVNLADGDIAKCFIIGSNFDEEDLARAQDAEMIARYQRVLHVSHPPRWYSLWSLVSCCSYLCVYVSDGIIVNRRVDSNLFPGLCSQSS